MAGKIYMIKDDDELIEINEKKHARELDFQELIKKYPDLIPGDQIDSENPRRWLFVGEEVHFPTLGGGDIRLDLLFIDQDGIPTLVEMKKSDNNELKRDVASQILEYGANILLSMDTRNIRNMVDENNDISINEFLNKETEEDEFWEKVYNNLKAEKIRLLVIADEIPNRLQNILEFINRNMDSVEILSVEIKQYTKDNETTLVSRVIGQSIEAQTKKASRTGGEPLLDENKFYENLDQNGKEFYYDLFKFIKKEQLKINCGTRGFSVNVPIEGNNVSIFRGYTNLSKHGQHLVSTSGFIKNKVKDGDKILEEYVKEITKLNGFYEAGDGFIYKIETKLDENDWEKFKEINSKIVKQIRTNGLNG
jgi:hypothetical protein